MDYQRFYIGNVSQQGEQFQIVDEIFCFLCIAFDFEGEDRTAAVREVFCVQCLLLWIVGYRRMMYFLNLRLALQIFYNLQRILNVTLYTERQSFQSLQKQEGVERRKSCSGITKKDGTYFCNECSRSNCFCEADAVVARVWLSQGCEFSGSLPVEFTAVYDHTAKSSSMAADEFGCGMNNDVCAVLDRTNEVWSCEGIIDNQRNLVLMCNFCKCFDIYNIGVRISEGLDVDGFCVLLNGCADLIQIEYINKCGADSVLRKSVRQQVVGTAVDVLCRYDVVALLRQVDDGVVNGCCSGSYCKCCNAAFQCCHSLLENVLGRVGQTAVDVSCILESESCCCVIGVIEYERRCLINRHCSCSGCRIWIFLSYVKL